MAEETNKSHRQGPPDPQDRAAFKSWLDEQPREWSVVIAARAALRILPLIGRGTHLPVIVLPAVRAVAAAQFAAKYPNSDGARAAARMAADYGAAYVAGAFADDDAYIVEAAAFAASAATLDEAAYGAAAAVDAAADAAYAAAAKQDAQRLCDGALTTRQLATSPLWPDPRPSRGRAWQELVRLLRASGEHWSVWIHWYENALSGAPRSAKTKVDDAAFTDIPGELPWDQGAEAVNAEIARRLTDPSRPPMSSEIPNQFPAPVRVEERNGRVSKSSDRDSALATSEQDFKAWRDPVIEHIKQLTASGFAMGTNHPRIRNRLVALEKLLPGEIAEVKERQFRIGYEIALFEGLMAAYRASAEDMAELEPFRLEEIDQLRIMLKMGIDKFERWAKFREQATDSTAGEADADREIVRDALEEMATVMEQRPQYFDPQLPATFRFLSEAMSDPRGAIKTVVYGAVKSAENLVSFLAQRALGIGKKGAEAVEAHISKAVAATLVTGLGGAAIQLSGALPHGWIWLKPVLAALAAGG